MSSEEEKKPDEGGRPADTDAERARKRRLRGLVLGAMAAGGAFQLNGWQAQAHGNRSSHSVTSLRAATVVADDVKVTGVPAADQGDAGPQPGPAKE
jgi:hypothetical protein